jgi:hypothetical protein
MQEDLALAEPKTVPAIAAVITPADDRRTTVLLGAAEVVLALGAAAAMTWWSRSIDVNPLVRVGQVSGLASLQLRFAFLGLVLVAVTVLVANLWRSRHAVPMLTRLSCSVIAGLATGLTAGGVVLALRGTSLPLNALNGDSSVISKWAVSILQGHSTLPNFYPPLPVHFLAGWASVSGQDVAFAFKDLQLIGTALYGPVAYLAWRLLLRPIPALAVGVVSALPLVYPYKPYENLVLIALIPVLAKLLVYLKTTPERSYRNLVLTGVAFGVVLGIAYLSYSGWFVWSAPGFMVAALILLPWRRAPLRALTFLAVTGVVLLGMCWRQIGALLHASSTVKDSYFYFDTATDPAYVAMWRGDMPGDVGLWPPPGELGGVGVFTVILCVGLAGALFLGLRNTIVITAACCLGGAWMLRFWFASQMYREQAVQLYPRTTMEILYLLLVLTVLAAYFGWERFREFYARIRTSANGISLPAKRVPSVLIGALCAFLLLFGSAGSATADRYLPRNDNSEGTLAWVGQTARMPNGKCSVYLEADCKTVR